MCASLANETECRPNVLLECHQSAAVDRDDGKMKRLPPKIILPLLGRNASCTTPVSHTLVCYTVILLYNCTSSTSTTTTLHTNNVSLGQLCPGKLHRSSVSSQTHSQ